MMTTSLYFLPKRSRQFAENCGDRACKKEKSTTSWKGKRIAHHEDFIFHSIGALTQLSSLLLLIAKPDIFIFLHFVIFIPSMSKIKSDYWVIKPTIFFELNFLVFFFNHTSRKILIILHKCFWNVMTFLVWKREYFTLILVFPQRGKIQFSKIAN